MKYKAILFDLDGTLTDPQKGICNCINYALSFYNKKRPVQELTKYIGPPLYNTFAELLCEEVAAEAIKKYRERFSTVGLYENEIYPNVKKTLKTLYDSGFIICTASSKPKIYVEQILKYFEIDNFFHIIGGATLDGSISEKKDVINTVLNSLKIAKNQVVMVGDTKYDLIGAMEMGLDAIGVTYGFGSKDELSEYPNIALIDDISHIVNLLK